MSAPATSTDRSGKARNRGFWALRDIPTVAWLLLVVVAAVAQHVLPQPLWLMVHLLVLGAVTHAILVWSQYFSFAMLRRQPTLADRRRQTWRLALANGGAALVVAGMLVPAWPVVVAGAAVLVAAVVWHGVEIVARSRGATPGRYGKTLRFYVAAAGLLPLGVALGVWLAHDMALPNVLVAHATLNVLGWIGLTVAGTIVTLWPTILRTRADDRATAGAVRALPTMVVGVLVAAAGALAELPPLFVLGLLAYLAGLVVIMVSLLRVARQAPPHTFAAMSVGLALVWWVGGVVALAVAAIVSFFSGDGFTDAAAAATGILPFLAAGFAAQVLLGALSYLVPVVVGGGPTPVRRGTALFDRYAAARVTVANGALAVCALPVSSVMRTVASVLYLAAMASFIPLMLVALRVQSRAKRQGAKLTEFGHGPITPEGSQPVGHRAGQAVAGLLAVVLAVAVTGAVNPSALGWESPAAAVANAPVQVVKVTAANFRFTPSTITVPTGTHLKIQLTNSDPMDMVHDLVFADGVQGGRISPGQTEMIDVGVITKKLDGWCSIPGHRQLGMVMTVEPGGAAPRAEAAPTTTASPGASSMPGMDMGASTGVDPGAKPGKGFTPYPAELAPLPPAKGPVTHHVTFTITDKKLAVAPGITQTLWTYNGTAPGPILHGRVGDTFVVTLINHGDMPHSIDFHAGSLAPDKPMRNIAPGKSLVYTFTATRAGIWMYHCASMPMSVHIAQGMYGAVVIDPPDLPPVAHTYVLLQGEYYLGNHNGGVVDVKKLDADQPDLVVFNGYANQYDYAPLTAKVGQRVRIWVLDAGPNQSESFHVVGGQFDTVWSEGRYLIKDATDTGSQALGLMPAQGGFVELTFPQAGHYPFITHFMVDAEKGAHGTFDVTP